jgi:UDP-N-acetylglucosamine 1-carboxyvinyltransferase
MADFFRVKGQDGEKTLEGMLPVFGAKNAVLPAMAASILFEDELTLQNVPGIEDVERMRELLTALGILIEREEHRCRLRAGSTLETTFPKESAERLRASIVATGPVLARFGSVTFPHPGGDVIGPRPIDLFLLGFQKMGASVTSHSREYQVLVHEKLRGADIFLPIVSVTATETLLMAATLARGTTVLKNAAMEPEIVGLADFLNTCGARISGAGTPTVTIEGGGLLHANGKPYTTPPDRIEAGSFLILGALAAKELDIVDCEPEHIAMLIDILERSGVLIERERTRIRVRGNGQNKRYKAVSVRTHEYPGFATDLQAPMTVFLTQATGEATIFETIFEGRLNYTEDLVKMGADITIFDPHRALVRGPRELRGRTLESPDIRAGLAFVMAAIVAKGESVINNVYHIDRGYEHIEKRLAAVGAPIERLSTL